MSVKVISGVGSLQDARLLFLFAAKLEPPDMLGGIAMIVAHTAVLATLVASTLLSWVQPVFDASSSIGIVMAQLAQMERGERRPIICTEQYAPVCARINNIHKTYPNQCYARAAGANVIAQSACTSSVVRPVSL